MIKPWQKIKVRKDGKIIKKYKLCGITLLRKEKSPTKKKWSFLGIKVCKKQKKIQFDTNELQIHDKIYLSDLIKYISFTKDTFVTKNIDSVTVLIPVFNGLEHLHNLIPSLIKNTPSTVKIIIIDDCSPDKDVQEYLQEINNTQNISVHKNKKNLGFVGSINNGMKLVKTRFVVWLNSDTIVPELWLERLLKPFNDFDKIATTTPFTNSGVIFSFPDFGVNNKLTSSLKKTDAAFQKIDPFDIKLNETYSGTGFCMAIDMRCWKEIGPLDIKKFGRGYGEENDWCFRALQKGWKHLLVPNLYIEHRHGGSFVSKEKKKLCDDHQKILRKLYSNEMKKIVPDFFERDPWSPYRKIAALLGCNQHTCIIIDLKKETSDVSGAIGYREKLVQDLIDYGHDVLLLQYARFEADSWSIIPLSMSDKLCIELKSLSEINLLFSILDVEKVIINNLAFLPSVEDTIDVIYNLKQKYKFTMGYKFHDYLSVCPSFFLLNEEGKNCKELKHPKKCATCLKNNRFKTLNRQDIFAWRNAWAKLFNIIDEFNFFSEYTFNKIKNVYPQVESRYTIKEHEPLFSEKYSKYKMPSKGNPLRIAFVGAFIFEKGAEYFIELQKIFDEKDIKAEFVIFGVDYFNKEHNKIKLISGYNRDILGKLLTENNIHMVVYPSVNNETFSYVAQELMILKVPFVCFSSGAHAERIIKYKYPFAEIAKDVSAESLYDATQKLLKKVYQINIS